jgi:hypothetical protein
VRNGWVFSPGLDLAAFVGPLLLAGAVILWADRTGRLHAEVPPWAFFALVVCCDVAHVWGTLFRAYLDPEERRRRPGLLLGVPLACLAVGTLLYAQDDAWFWRVLAYVAAFHFVRQTWGWMSYSARRAGETDPLDRALDRAAVYASTLWPLLWWHAHLPRPFVWFVDGDFVAGLPGVVADVGLAVHAAILLAWVGRQVVLLATGRPVNLAKALVLASTWLAWVGGIVLLRATSRSPRRTCCPRHPYAILVHRVGCSGPRRAAVSRALPAVGAPASSRSRGARLARGPVDRPSGTSTPGCPAAAPDPARAVVGFLVPLLAVPWRRTAPRSSGTPGGSLAPRRAPAPGRPPPPGSAPRAQACRSPRAGRGRLEEWGAGEEARRALGRRVRGRPGLGAPVLAAAPGACPIGRPCTGKNPYTLPPSYPAPT